MRTRTSIGFIPRFRRWRGGFTTTSIPAYPGPGRFKGAARITLRDGRVFETVEEYNRGSRENPMSEAELRAKFEENAATFLNRTERDRLAAAIAGVETLPDAALLARLCVGAGAG